MSSQCQDREQLAELQAENKKLREENERLSSWVADLHSGMYVNCVYCGFRYGPRDCTPCTQAEALKAHIAVCRQHPMAELLTCCRNAEELLTASVYPSLPYREVPTKTEAAELLKRLALAIGNATPGLALEM